MSAYQRHTQLNQDRSAGGSHDAVVRSGGNAHAKNNAAEHGKNQADDKEVASGKNDSVDEHGGQAGNGDASSDHAGQRACYGNGNGIAGTCSEGIGGGPQGGFAGFKQNASERVFFSALFPVGEQEVDETDNKRHEDRDGGRYCHGIDTSRYDPN